MHKLLSIALISLISCMTVASDHTLQANRKTHTLEFGSLRRSEHTIPEYTNPANGFVTLERTTVAYTYYQRASVLRVVHRNTPHNSSNPAWYTGYNQDRHGENETQLGEAKFLNDAERWFGYYDLFWKYLENRALLKPDTYTKTCATAEPGQTQYQKRSNNKQIPQDWK